MSCDHTPPNDDPYNPFNSSCEECSRLNHEIENLKVRVHNLENDLVKTINSIRELTKVLVNHYKEKGNG